MTPLGASPTTSSTRPTSPRSSARSRDDTRLIWVESPTNPLLNVVDIEGVVARRRGALVAVDNTFATPANQRPLELGADFVVHSTTKYLGGHSDVVGGVVITRSDELVRAAAVRPERGRRRAGAVRLLPRPPRPAHAAPADGGARAQRARRSSSCCASTPERAATSAGLDSAAWSASATRARPRSRPARACSRSPSRSAASSR